MALKRGTGDQARAAGISVEQETGAKSILDPLMEVLP